MHPGLEHRVKPCRKHGLDELMDSWAPQEVVKAIVMSISRVVSLEMICLTFKTDKGNYWNKCL